MRIHLLFLGLLAASGVFAQEEGPYVPPTDTAVQRKIAWWQDLKFGLLMHWGTYSQWGIVESWSLCPEDEGWTQRKGPYSADYFTYKKAYENLLTTFNPTSFDPSRWAAAAKAAGMRYVVFTTKHHDGFCMFDTHQTDYSVMHSPFHRNIALEVFNAFRSQGFGIGAYFSKPDWHSNDYWWSYFPPKDRNVNYDPAKYPERWQHFKDYTYNQIQELMSGYGHMDILWLDGGWVHPNHTEGHFNQDIDMARIASMARGYQPGLIVVDRAVGGPFENYRTPEQQVPTQPLTYPWETCMTMGDSWSYVPGDHYKPSSQLIHLLVRIVAWGGNFLLNVGPSPDGDWDPLVYERLRDIGGWMNINGSAIYGSRMIAPYGKDRVYYTRSADTTYVFYLSAEGSDTVSLPPSLPLDGFTIPAGSRVTLLGSGARIPFSGSVLMIPHKLVGKEAGKYAVVFAITKR
ncbi:alpha-L-fucosidase [Dinghuibacter silviterrae]|nr:alpha-L-fucosidase [Dinghuibacter silviterrae]